MKHVMIKYAMAAVCALVFAGALFSAPFAMRVFADEPQNVAKVDEEEYATFEDALTAWQDNTTLTLLQDVTAETTVEVTGNKTLDLSSHSISLKTEASDSLLEVEGILTVKGGKLTGGNAERGGGIYVDSRGQLTLENCTVSGNTASKDGGGVYVAGTITLAGNTVVENNTDGNGNASNIFLTNGNRIRLNGFTGRAGVTVISVDEPFAAEDAGSTGAFFSDDKRYVTEDGKLKTAPLATVTAVYENNGKVFPTTPLEELKQFITVSGVNVNGIAYTKPLTFELSGNLIIGTSAITVTATGEGGETAQTEVSVEVSKPTLQSIEVIAPETQPKVYFDSPLSALTGEGGYTFRGLYDDGNPRFLSPAGEGEDGYTLEGDLTKRTEGKSTITVRVGSVSETFEVEVSKYAISLSQADIRDLMVLEGEAVSPRSFVPALPVGLDVIAAVQEGDISALPPGVYEVKLSFAVTDAENYEEVTAQFSTHLTVLRKALAASMGKEGSCLVEREGGLLPAWSFSAEEITNAVTVNIEGSLEAHAVYELTLEEGGMAVEEPGPLTVRLTLGEDLKGEEVTLYLLQSDGSLVKVDATREEDGLLFTADSLAHARYVVAVETASQVYLILSIVFGAACLLGAAAVVAYLAVKRKKAKKY